jgi:hypothetical protein
VSIAIDQCIDRTNPTRSIHRGFIDDAAAALIRNW